MSRTDRSKSIGGPFAPALLAAQRQFDLADEYEDCGVWPPWWKKLWWDICPWRRPRSTDGLEAPIPKRPYWLDEAGCNDQVVLEVAREGRLHAERMLERADGRARRLLQTSLVLLVICFGSTTFLLTELLDGSDRSRIWLGLLIPSAISLLSLVFSALQALGSDRVGLVMAPRPGPIAAAEEGQRLAVAAEEEARSALIAAWTTSHKLTEFNRARRWMSRGIVALVMSGIAVLVVTFVL